MLIIILGNNLYIHDYAVFYELISLIKHKSILDDFLSILLLLRLLLLTLVKEERMKQKHSALFLTFIN